MLITDLIEKIRLYTGDTRQTRYSDDLIKDEIKRCLDILSEATKARVSRRELIKVTANKTVYELADGVIETNRFEQLLFTSSDLSVSPLTHLPMVSEADIANGNLDRTDDFQLSPTYSIRDDKSQTTLVAVVKETTVKSQVEVYPRLIEPKTTLTQQQLDYMNNNGLIDTTGLVVGENPFVIVMVHYKAYLTISADGSSITLEPELARMLEHLTAHYLLSYDTNSSSVNSSKTQLDKYRAELQEYRRRQNENFHKDKDRGYKLRKRGKFTSGFQIGDVSEPWSDFGPILPIRD